MNVTGISFCYALCSVLYASNGDKVLNHWFWILWLIQMQCKTHRPLFSHSISTNRRVKYLLLHIYYFFFFIYSSQKEHKNKWILGNAMMNSTFLKGYLHSKLRTNRSQIQSQIQSQNGYRQNVHRIRFLIKKKKALIIITCCVIVFIIHKWFEFRGYVHTCITSGPSKRAYPYIWPRIMEMKNERRWGK